MHDGIKVFFAVQDSQNRDELWPDWVAQYAREMGFEVQLNPLSGTLSSDQWAELLADVDALITTWRAPSLDERVLARNERLKIVGHAAGSVANTVTPYLYERGVRVVTANSAMARSVAEWNYMMTFVAARRLVEYTSFASPLPPLSARRDRARSPRELVVGIWGFGDVAKHLIGMFQAEKPGRLLVHDPYLEPSEAERLGVERVDFETLIAESDILHTLTSLTVQNKGKVDADALARMKPGATLINAGRAPLVEEQALLEALRSGHINAILDVHYREPVPADYPFLGLPNLIMTPHCAGRPGRDQYVPLVLREFDRFFRGLPLHHEISRERAMNMTDASLLRR